MKKISAEGKVVAFREFEVKDKTTGKVTGTKYKYSVVSVGLKPENSKIPEDAEFINVFLDDKIDVKEYDNVIITGTMNGDYEKWEKLTVIK